MGDQEVDQKALIADVFDRAAPGYAQLGFFHDYARRLVELARIDSGMKVLDLGTGRGAVLFPAAEQVGPQGQVIGIDLSQTMVEQTAAEVRRRNLKSAAVRRMDAENLEFPEASFDRVLCGFSLMFFPRLQLALAEIHRVLRPTGRITVTTWGKGDKRWDWYYELIRTYQKPVKLMTQFLDNPNDLRASLTQASFIDIEVVAEETDVVYLDEEAWWAMKWSGAERATLEQMRPAVLAEFKATVFDKIQALKQPDGVHELDQVLYTSARKPLP